MTDKDTLTIYVWPDGTWISEENVDGDFEWYLMFAGKSDDYASYDVSYDLDDSDIEELISLNALPGMLPDKPDTNTDNLEHQGKVPIPEGAILIVHHSKDIEYQAVTMLKDRLIVNAPNIMIEVIQSKEDKDE